MFDDRIYGPIHIHNVGGLFKRLVISIIRLLVKLMRVWNGSDRIKLKYYKRNIIRHK